MSRKNNAAKHKRINQQYIDHEKKRLDKNAANNARRKVAATRSDRSIENARKEIARKHKVAPVVASSTKQSRMLAEGLKSMSLKKKGAAGARKIDMADSSDDEELALDTNGDIVGKVKPIFKKANYMFSRKRL
jgi:hypothetical protein